MMIGQEKVYGAYALRNGLPLSAQNGMSWCDEELKDRAGMSAAPSVTKLAKAWSDYRKLALKIFAGERERLSAAGGEFHAGALCPEVERYLDAVLGPVNGAESCGTSTCAIVGIIFVVGVVMGVLLGVWLCWVGSGGGGGEEEEEEV